MIKLDNPAKKFYTPAVREIGRIFFYIGLFLEIFIFLYDRSDLHNPCQSLMFRVTFILFLVKCLCTEYNKREWLFIILCAAFSILTYRLSGKDEVIRACVFIIAMKDMDVKRTLRVSFWLTLAGIVVLGLLSIFNVMGNVTGTGVYGDKSGRTLFEFGLGSSNTWAIQIWLLTALYIYLYHDVMHMYSYWILLLMGFGVYGLTRCRTELMMMAFTCFFGYVFERFKKAGKNPLVYLSGALILLAEVGFSVYSARISVYWDQLTENQQVLNNLVTGRISSLCAFLNGGGVLSNWKLFGDPYYVEYFDMGIVRLFWWYGIIPGALAVISCLIYFYYCYKKGDFCSYLLVLSICIFTLLEAHFISPFLVRNYYLFLIGGCWTDILGRLSKEKAKRKLHIAFYIGALSKGGAERVFINLAEYFLSVGYDVTFITQYKKEDEYPLPDQASRYISDLTETELGGRIGNFFRRISKLHGIIRLSSPDLLMTTIGKANFMAIVCSAFLPTRVVVSVVAEPSLEYPTKAMRILAQTLFAEADGIVMQTGRQQRFLRYALRKRSVILPNSVSPRFIPSEEELKKREALYLKRDADEAPDPASGQDQAYTRRIYMVGRMDENKNQLMGIQAFGQLAADYPDATLTVCGDGPLREKLMEVVGTYKLDDRIDMPGSVDDVPGRLLGAYAFLLTSDTEGMPNTLLEAMSLGVPCISTDCPCGGPAQIIDDGVNGLLVKTGDTDGLTAALRKLLEDPELACRIGFNAYESLKDYRPERVNALWKDYFDCICGLKKA